MATGDYGEYVRTLVTQLWTYRKEHFVGRDDFFDEHRKPAPPVFKKSHANWNVLVRRDAGQDERAEVWGAIPKRHVWFRSMKSSQALAHSVFANLQYHHKLDLLPKLKGDDGEDLFCWSSDADLKPRLEHEVAHLGEWGRGRTSLDVFFEQGPYRIAVECKLAESKFGQCSRPLLKPGAANYETDYCDGRYVRQHGRECRCPLTAKKVKYWEHVPQLFDGWNRDIDGCPCPLNETYQLVRNLLAVCVRPGPSVDPAGGRVVVIYDSCNPAFKPSGEADRVYNIVKSALLYPHILHRTTWQKVVACLRVDPEMIWLADAIADKYKIV